MESRSLDIQQDNQTHTTGSIIVEFTINTASLLMSATAGNQEIVQLLINSTINLNTQDKNGDTALILAVKHEHKEIVSLLIKANVNINIQNNKGKTALSYAATNNQEDFVTQLISAKANINIAKENKSTALISAARRGYHSIVKRLIAAGAELNHQDMCKDTALTVSIRKCTKCAIDLLKAGASVEYENIDKETAFDIACRYRHLHVLKLLLEHHTQIRAPLFFYDFLFSSNARDQDVNYCLRTLIQQQDNLLTLNGGETEIFSLPLVRHCHAKAQLVKLDIIHQETADDLNQLFYAHTPLPKELIALTYQYHQPLEYLPFFNLNSINTPFLRTRYAIHIHNLRKEIVQLSTQATHQYWNYPEKRYYFFKPKKEFEQVKFLQCEILKLSEDNNLRALITIMITFFGHDNIRLDDKSLDIIFLRLFNASALMLEFLHLQPQKLETKEQRKCAAQIIVQALKEQLPSIYHSKPDDPIIMQP